MDDSERSYGYSKDIYHGTRGEIVVVIGPARETGTADIGFAIDALRGLVRAGARPRAAASVVSALTGVPANDLYKGLTGREPRR